MKTMLSLWIRISFTIDRFELDIHMDRRTDIELMEQKLLQLSS